MCEILQGTLWQRDLVHVNVHTKCSLIKGEKQTMWGKNTKLLYQWNVAPRV